MRRMLIVDDERDICDCLEQFFSTRGFSVVCAYSGEAALKYLAQASADVMLLDIVLPGLSGIDVLKQVKALAPATQVLVVTAVDQGETREAARRYGAAAYITKPFDFDESTWSVVLTASTEHRPPHR